MSIRPSEASRFSLRAVVAEEPLEERKFVLNGIVHTPKPASAKDGGGKGLRFDFSSLQQKKPATDEAQRGKPFIAPMKNAFDVSNESSKADVMRLTIMVEDLNSRVKKASERAATAETQLQKTQIALMTERNNSASRIKAVSAELASARATESHLRAELSSAASKASKQALKVDKFESAVASALAADKSVEATKKQMEALKVDVASSKQRVDMMTSELIEMHSKNSVANASVDELKSKVAAAEKELSLAKSAERKAVSERDALKSKLEEALLRASAAEETAAELHKKSEESQKDEAPAEAPVEEDVVPPVATAVSSPTERSNVPDPIKMHKKYQAMRTNVLSLSQKIVEATHSGLPEDTISKLTEKRSAAYIKAIKYKHRYDTIFGAVENETTTDAAAPQGKGAAFNAQPVSEPHYRVLGEAPDACFPNVSSDAYKEACVPRFGMPINMGSSDCAQDIGSVMLSAHTLEISVDAEDPEPTGNHDAQGDMINSVVSDLKAFLVDAKERDDRAHLVAMSV